MNNYRCLDQVIRGLIGLEKGLTMTKCRCLDQFIRGLIGLGEGDPIPSLEELEKILTPHVNLVSPTGWVLRMCHDRAGKPRFWAELVRSDCRDCHLGLSRVHSEIEEDHDQPMPAHEEDHPANHAHQG